MADSVETNETGAAVVQPANGDQQNLMSRVSNLPLVSSAYGAVSSAYSTTKDSVPLFKGVMDAAESGVRTLGAAASTGSKPLLDMLEPQIATVNDYAMMGLDKMEEKMPILQQPADKLVSDTVGMVCQSVAGAKDAMTGAMMGAVKGGMEMTRAAVSGGISTVLSTRVGQMVSSGVGLALSQSENWVEHNLPLSERELAALAEPATDEPSTPPSSPSYFVRLGKLSAKVQERALQHSLFRARHARDTTYSAMAQISSTLDLVESTRATRDTASTKVRAASEKLHQLWKEWREKQPEEELATAEVDSGKDETQQLELHTLSMVRGLSGQLRAACSGVVSSTQGLPVVVQDQLTSARNSAEELHSSLGSTTTLTPVLLEQSRRHITQVKQSLDGVMDYLLNNTPLNWLVGPFAPQLRERGEGDPAVEMVDQHK